MRRRDLLLVVVLGLALLLLGAVMREDLGWLMPLGFWMAAIPAGLYVWDRARGRHSASSDSS